MSVYTFHIIQHVTKAQRYVNNSWLKCICSQGDVHSGSWLFKVFEYWTTVAIFWDLHHGLRQIYQFEDLSNYKFRFYSYWQPQLSNICDVKILFTINTYLASLNGKEQKLKSIYFPFLQSCVCLEINSSNRIRQSVLVFYLTTAVYQHIISADTIAHTPLVCPVGNFWAEVTLLLRVKWQRIVLVKLTLCHYMSRLNVLSCYFFFCLPPLGLSCCYVFSLLLLPDFLSLPFCFCLLLLFILGFVYI